MNKPKISIIVAVADNLAIGKNNKLLWYIPEDLQHFKKITSGHTVLMGQKTYESLAGPLPGRTNIVVTLDPNYRAEGCKIVHSLDEALEEAGKEEKEEVFIIGGGSIYKQMLPHTDKLYITKVEGDFEADTYFPDYKDFGKVVYESDPQQSGEYKYKFMEIEREK